MNLVKRGINQMTSRNKFSKLTDNFLPERRKRIEGRKLELREEMALNELRQALGTS
tara:strand:- start:639 stop:806 length:168 start_codon:yes stop_codon:yes gene_type:complete